MRAIRNILFFIFLFGLSPLHAQQVTVTITHAGPVANLVTADSVSALCLCRNGIVETLVTSDSSSANVMRSYVVTISIGGQSTTLLVSSGTTSGTIAVSGGALVAPSTFVINAP